MDIVIMKTGKSRLVNDLSCGGTVFINLTTSRPPLPEHIDSCLFDVKSLKDFLGVGIIECFDFVEQYDTVIFYTKDKYSDCIGTARYIENVLADNLGVRVVFMFAEE